MNDLISRQQAIDALRDYLVEKRCPDDGTLTCRLIENEVINKLPPAEPKRGEWTYQNGMIICDQCLRAIRSIDHDGLLNFCPNCGAKMEENNESD